MTRSRLAHLLPLLLLAPAAAAAQPGPQPGSVPFTLTVRGGWDIEFDDPVLGAVAYIPTPLVRGLGIQVAGDLTFLDDLTERQLALDALYDLGGLRVGGGPVFRNSLWVVDGAGGAGAEVLERETRTGFSLVAAFGGTPSRDSPWTFGLEFRFIWVDDFRPRPFTFGVGVVPGRLLGG
ncbi:MAG: hypothetical protein RQ751_12380 [Longimicrobiales bacterium]|nr:hypothetical protein [Longimicrobiales bacterium]